MKKFVVLFAIPAKSIDEWMKTDEATRKKQTDEMMQAWQQWMKEHDKEILDKGLPLGKTKRVTSEGVSDYRNDLNWYLVIEGESHQAVADMLKSHPHLKIPTAYAEVMDASRMGM